MASLTSTCARSLRNVRPRARVPLPLPARGMRSLAALRTCGPGQSGLFRVLQAPAGKARHAMARRCLSSGIGDDGEQLNVQTLPTPELVDAIIQADTVVVSRRTR